jgi:hypothetical protein
MKRNLDAQLRTCTSQYERQRVLTQAGTQLLRAASRKPSRRPALREPAPQTLRAKGWHSLDELKTLMTRRSG